VFVTAFYSFRMFFLVFHGEERFGKGHADHHGDHDDEEPAADHHHGLAPGDKPHESPWVVTAPLILLALPSVFIGYLTIGPMLHGDFFKDSIAVNAAAHPAMATIGAQFHGALAMALHAPSTLVFWLDVAGVGAAWFIYLKRPAIAAAVKRRFEWVYRLLDNKYYMDWFNEHVLSAGARLLGTGLWKGGDEALIDGVAINGSARVVGGIAQLTRLFQTGYLYFYALVMLLGIFALMTWQLWPQVRGLFGF
jgi:NADH-quinone oxidoreductase subunit L